GAACAADRGRGRSRWRQVHRAAGRLRGGHEGSRGKLKRSMRASGTEGYGETADVLAKQYESLAFADVHRHILHLFPPAPSTVLDIGAGTGRDAAGFCELGHTVTAVEPTPEMRAHGQRLHGHLPIRWIDDSLPDLDRLQALGECYDVVMLTAVWMHLDAG